MYWGLTHSSKQKSSEIRSWECGGQTTGPYNWFIHRKMAVQPITHLVWKLRKGATVMNIKRVHPPVKTKVFFQRNQHTLFHQNDSLSCMVYLGVFKIQAQMLILNFCLIEGCQAAWGFSRAYSCRLWRKFTPLLENAASSVNNTQCDRQVHWSCVEATDRTGGKDYCSLAAALAQAVHEQDTTVPHAVYAKCTLRKAHFMCDPSASR
jgi:hypothetical protein